MDGGEYQSTFSYNGTSATVKNVNVKTTGMMDVSTLDIAPSILYAMDAGGEEGFLNKTGRIVLIYVDALGYDRYMDARSNGLVNNISSLGEPIKAVCVFPSVTQANAKSMATGLAPNMSKGDFRSYEPEGKTIVEILNEQGQYAVWVDGQSPPVNISSTVYRLDANGDDSADDEVVDAAIWEYRTGSKLTILHFKSTDLEMHDYGPYSPEARASLQTADSLIGILLASMDGNTTVIVYSDHGCHNIYNGGNHGTLLPDDMYIPIIVGRA
jgi:predicted AlkP superfamily phosphohydrolase/phosphomutase